jgi:very-short-patch-repair endonuclease
VELQQRITCEWIYYSTANYAMQQNYVPLVRKITLTNHSNEDIMNVAVTLAAEPAFAKSWSKTLDVLPAGQTVDLGTINVQLLGTFLAGLTERLAGTIDLTVMNGEITLLQESAPINVLAFDEWNGLAVLPELIAAFVTPNHPEILRITREASQILGKWSGSPSFDGYQSMDPNRVQLQVAAIYAALQARDLVYSVGSPSYEDVGQRIRLPETIFTHRLGNCLDITLLYTACLEAIGLHPLVVFIKGHAFVGAWLIKETFAESVQDDVSLLTKRIAAGVGEICLVEATALVAGQKTSFEQAERAAQAHLMDETKFDCFIDIKRARTSSIRPLPMRILTSDGWELSEEEMKKTDYTDAPGEKALYARPVEVESIPITKQKQWERRLLDLSLRNTLLNFRLTQSSIPLMSTQLNELEDALAESQEFQILAKPLDWADSTRNLELFQSISHDNPVVTLLTQEFAQKRLRAELTELDLNNRIVNLYRSARVSIEENGANTLFLALGLLKWYETSASQKPRYAPLVMIPIDIIKKSSRLGFIVRQRDEDPQMNITLLEMLKQDFQLDIGGLDPLPKEEKGMDLKRVFTLIRHAVMHMPRWDIVESGYLGLFSFSQFVMWNDIRTRSEDLAKNKIVASLMAGQLQYAAEALTLNNVESLDEKYHPKQLALPISADSSQLSAISSAAEGKSFVLHGPPGTGKSQTITNMIANALADGKTVLFVAEKMAALTVVQKRLANIGLGPFCMELHSNKSTKKAVLEQLRLAMEVNQDTSAGTWESEANRLALMRQELNAYVEALHKKQAFGFSLYEALTHYGRVRAASDAIKFNRAQAEALSPEKWTTWKDIVEEIRVAGEACGEPASNAWEDAACTSYSQTLKDEASGIITKYRNQLSEYEAALAEVIEVLQLNNVVNQANVLPSAAQLSELLAAMPVITASMLRVEDVENVVSRINSIVKHGIVRDELRAKVFAQFTTEVLTFGAAEALAELQKVNQQWFLAKFFGLNRLRKSMRSLLVPGKTINKAEMEEQLKLIIQLQAEEKAINETEAFALPILGNMWNGGNASWSQLSEASEWLLKLHKQIAEMFQDSQDRKALHNRLADVLVSGRDSFLVKNTPILQRFVDLKKQVDASEKEFAQLLVIDLVSLKEKSGSQSWFTYMNQKSARWLEHLAGLRDWCTWRRVRSKADEAGLGAVIQPYEQGKLRSNEIVAGFERAIYKACAELIIASDERLNSFSSKLFEETIKKFSDANDRFETLTQREIYARLAAKVPQIAQSAAQSSESGILLRAIRSNGRGISIRKLFEQIPNLLNRLCPCMLMSPISVAQYLDPKNTLFDLVVFDEASQMPTSGAVGAMARGRNVVIVGDPKQLPPTSFFAAAASLEENEDGLATEDLESILDDCMVLGMPQAHLLWHYRSRHESLIAFSNTHYYENKLLTFPSPNELVSRVSLRHIDGIYDRGKTKHNRAEAEAVVKEIIRRLQDRELSKLSMGVVTFSSVQQNLIEDLLDEAFRLNPDLELLSTESAEPIFVKNLENVQGDERDVILFSIGYGPDSNGKVSLNFGPLNRDGGWRRLNVAVSRARHEMIVFSALEAHDLDVSRTSAQGVAGLKAFLDYAAKGRLALAVKNTDISAARALGIEQQIADALKLLGYEVHLHIGSSGYRIDLAIVDAKLSGKYLLGITCDGYAYHNSRTARDRDILRSQVLQQLGWTLHKVWSMDWLESPDREIQKIVKAIELAVEAAERLKQNVLEQEASVIETIEHPSEQREPFAELKIPVQKAVEAKAEAVFPEYKIHLVETVELDPEEFYAQSQIRRICKQISEVIEHEGPISRPLLSKRILTAWGISRSGVKNERYFTELLSKIPTVQTKAEEIEFYWPLAVAPDQYDHFRVASQENERRNAEDLPVEEAASAVKYTLSMQISLLKLDLVKEVAKLLGYPRGSAALDKVIKLGITEAEKRGYVRIDELDRVIYQG